MRIKVEDDGCWTWAGADTGASGYGVVIIGDERWLVHRLMYRVFVGAIPPGKEIDHLCRNHACCNPAHLEAVTRAENVHRGLYGVLKTHCARGHEWNTENTFWSVQPKHPNGGRRVCRICRDENARRHQEKIKADPQKLAAERERKSRYAKKLKSGDAA